MEIRATAKIKIKATPEIVQTLKVYSKGLQFCINTAWDKKIRNNIKLHPFVYKKLKNMGLQSQLAIACIKQACGMVKRAKSKPIINKVSMRYNFPRSASLKNNVLSLATIKGRVKIPFAIPECYMEYFSWNVKESLLTADKKNRCFFLFTFSKDINSESSNFQRVLGIDVGVNHLAVTSNNKLYGKGIMQLRVKRDKLISRIQAKGTKSAKRKLKAISGRWQRFMAWINHNISRDIVDSVSEGSIIVMEDISNIRKTAKYNKWIHKWAFRQLQNFIEYKAIRKGCRVVYINPKNTFRECSVCHNKVVRHNGFIECLHCGFSLNSDLNASRNIARRYICGLLGLAPVTEPNVSSADAEASCDEMRQSLGTTFQKPYALA
jgi:IS605 OrfB family transposase